MQLMFVLSDPNAQGPGCHVLIPMVFHAQLLMYPARDILALACIHDGPQQPILALKRRIALPKYMVLLQRIIISYL